MESLLLFRRALSSPTMCRFIPALLDCTPEVRHAASHLIGDTPGLLRFVMDRQPPSRGSVVIP